jgi:hypothetical protein
MTLLLRHRLEPSALESGFRADALTADTRVVSGLTVVAVIFLLVTLPTIFSIEGQTLRLHVAEAIRAVDVAAALASLFLIRRVDSARAYDAIVTAWIAVWFLGVVGENALLPAGATDFTAWDVFLAIATYAALPLSLPRQAALAAVLSVGDLFVLWTLKVRGRPDELYSLVLAYACANVVGVFISRARHALRRRTFVTWRQAVEDRGALETALQEVKTLQGIIPICSFCKSIRTGAGDWLRLEEYVHAHTDAQFSHGICPHCLRKHYDR